MLGVGTSGSLPVILALDGRGSRASEQTDELDQPFQTPLGLIERNLPQRKGGRLTKDDSQHQPWASMRTCSHTCLYTRVLTCSHMCTCMITCSHVCMHMHSDVHICVCACVYLHVHKCACTMCACMFTNVPVHVCTHTSHVSVHVCTHMFTHVSVYVCTHKQICIYIPHT